MRRISIWLSIIICIYLDSVFFDRVNLYGVRPDCLLALIVTLGILMGSLPAAVIGTLAGLFTDIFFGEFVGYNAAIFLVMGMASGFFYRKYYADNLIVPAVTAVFTALAKELINAGVLFLTVGRYSFASMFARYILPGSLMTTAMCILMMLILKPVLTGHYKRAERNF
jgi:rod shape-determining protein MreD